MFYTLNDFKLIFAFYIKMQSKNRHILTLPTALFHSIAIFLNPKEIVFLLHTGKIIYDRMKGFCLDLSQCKKSSFDSVSVSKYFTSIDWKITGLTVNTKTLDKEWPSQLYTSLRYLYLQDDMHSSYNLLTNCTNLKKLSFICGHYSDLNKCNKSTTLEELIITGEYISTPTFLSSSLSNLTYLDITFPYIKDLDFLVHMPNLAHLHLNNCPRLESINMLKVCPHLSNLYLPSLSNLKEVTTFEPYLTGLTCLNIAMGPNEVKCRINISLFPNLLDLCIYLYGNTQTFTPIIESSTLVELKVETIANKRDLDTIIAPNLAKLYLRGLSIPSFKNKIANLDKLQSLVLDSCIHFNNLEGVSLSLNYFKMINCDSIRAFNTQSHSCMDKIEIRHCTLLTSCLFPTTGCKTLLLGSLPLKEILLSDGLQLENISITMCESLDKLVLPICTKQIQVFHCNKLQLNQDLPHLTKFKWFNKHSTNFPFLSNCSKLEKCNIRSNSLNICVKLWNTIKNISSLVKLTLSVSEWSVIPNLSKLINLRCLKLDYSSPKDILELQNLPCLEELHLLDCGMLENINMIQGCTTLRKLFISEANGILNWEPLGKAIQLVELEIGWIEQVNSELILEALESNGKRWVLQDNKFLLLH